MTQVRIHGRCIVDGVFYPRHFVKELSCSWFSVVVKRRSDVICNLMALYRIQSLKECTNDNKYEHYHYSYHYSCWQ